MSVKREVGFGGTGPYTCDDSSHPEPHITDNLEEHFVHLATPGHFDVDGTAPCAICGKEVNYKSKATGKAAVCDDCKEDLRKELNL